MKFDDVAKAKYDIQTSYKPLNPRKLKRGELMKGDVHNMGTAAMEQPRHFPTKPQKDNH